MWDIGGDAFDLMEDVKFLEFAELSLDESKLENELITENVDNAWYFICCFRHWTNLLVVHFNINFALWTLMLYFGRLLDYL